MPVANDSTFTSSARSSAIRTLLLTVLLAPLAAIGQQADDSKATSSPATLPEGTVAIVNGSPISDLAVENVAQQIISSGQEADRQQILDELINLEILTQAAEAFDLDKMPEISAALQLQYTQTMANAYLAKKGAEMVFSEDDLRAEYDAQSAAVDRAEYRAAHILLNSREDAQDMIAELSAGKEFGALAKLHSVDPASENGGDLGWFQAGTMVDEFTAAVAGMEVGDTSSEPVQTEYGYHVIKLLDKRESALPDFESVKPGLTNLAVRKALARHVEELRETAQIKMR